MSRIDYFQHSPQFITKLRNITLELDQFTIDAKLRALVETRVSQINGCVYCVDLHLKESRSLGEIQQRLDSLPVWRESPYFDHREKSAFAWAESLTNIAETHATDADYNRMKQHFSDLEIVELSISIAMANFWNRMAGGFRRMPKVTNID
jgi:AhpD family alkylhydroperoxidase